MQNSINIFNSKSIFARIMVALLAVSLFLTGCGDGKLPTQVVLTTDFIENEVFRLEGYPCMKNEVMVYLANSENQYSKVFGEQIWDVPIEDGTLEQAYKDTILARIAQIKAMNLLAREYNVTLDENEDGRVIAAAKDYMASLDASEIAYLDINQDVVAKLYREFAVANKLYKTITSEIKPEISDDEARTITVRTILIKTYTVDSNGNKIPYTAEEKKGALERIKSVQTRLEEGETFEVLAADYNEDTNSEYSFGRNVMPEKFEEAAFNLGNGEISDIVETEYGYHLILCVSTFNPEETENTKLKIVEERRQEAFEEVYQQFVVTLTSNLNKDLWDTIYFDKSQGVTTSDFFAVYDEYFSGISLK